MTGPKNASMYFFAILCPPPASSEIQHLKEWMRARFDCRVALRSPAHITIIPPFWLNAEGEDNLVRIARSFQIPPEPIGIVLDGFSHFGKSVLFVRVAPNEQLEELKAAATHHFISGLGNIIKYDERPFQPHVTIATRDLKPADFFTAWERFSDKPFHFEFESQELTMLKLADGKWQVQSAFRW